jgi:predicted XRE-type DNA-binding protein
MAKKSRSVIAVITGDVVGSRKIKERKTLINSLHASFREIPYLKRNKEENFQIFRGDSFQLIVEDIDRTLDIAFLLRAGLMKKNKKWDARIAIGIGSQEFRVKTIAESDGEAFRNSGYLLDKLLTANTRLGLKTPWPEMDEEFKVSLELADALIKKWSQAGAETAWHYFMGLSQMTMAEALEISQPAVNKRVAAASLHALALVSDRFQKQVNKFIP